MYLISNIEIIKSICAMLARGAIISAIVIILFLTPLLLASEKLIGKTTIGWKKGKKEDAGRSESSVHPETPEPQPLLK